MNSLSELLAYDGYVIPIVLAIVLVIALGVVMGITTRLRRLEKRYQRLLGAESHGDAQELLLDFMGRVERLSSSLDATQGRLDMLEAASVGHVQHVGVVRYDAFDDVGGALSFSLALLDGAKNGVVITSMAGRYETRMYAKAVTAGRSAHALSKEETEAIARATEGSKDRPQG